ncbi:DUF1634 domain-containing protein [Edaphobacter bradus]|uniref:DUF1634 domain-containing protein n=1 Tax=Edaphobacter bradus TaxID=2259016 RepID=UPI0021DF5C12|nr:DUF1634 domain-containing protein [Edaphobacter bradus]
MTEERRPFDDQRMDAIMGRLLQSGVLLASAVVLVGGLLYLKAHPHTSVNYRTFVSEPAELRHPGALLREVAAGNAAALIQFGVLLLVATPIARVVFAVIAFAMERDRLYVAISLFVLAVLMFGLLHGV